MNINLSAVKKTAADLVASRELRGEHRAAWLLKAITCIDLTTLSGDDTNSNVSRLCIKVIQPPVAPLILPDSSQACSPLSKGVLNALGFDEGPESPIHAAAVCVYPSKVENAASALRKLGYFDKIHVASGDVPECFTRRG